jgi:citrate synthase
VNQRLEFVDQGRADREWVTTEEATKLLGVKRETLYAYASRGLVRSAASSASASGSSGKATRGRVYNRADVDRLRARSQARSGHAAVAASALRWGEPVLETSVGSIGRDGPIYRGRLAVELAREGASFEDVCELLWGPTSSWGQDKAGAAFRPEEDLDALRLGAPVAHLRALLRSHAEPFDGMLITAAALAAAEQHVEPSLEVARSRAAALMRRLVASCGLVTSADAVTASLEAETTARALLVALGGRTTAPSIAALTEALVLSADHELNPSTFAARVAASAGASLPACAMAALAALSGPLHGGATARVEAFVAEVARPERGAAAVGERLARGDSVPGFGHPLYPEGDPRGARLLEVAQRLSGKSRGVRILVSVVNAMQLVARERPTIDVGLVALSAALGLPRGAALAIFSCGRVAGLIAHALEQRAANFILRPRARYTGASPLASRASP